MLLRDDQPRDDRLTTTRRIGAWTLHSAADRLPLGLEVSDGSWTYTTAPFSHAAVWHALGEGGTLRAIGSDPVALARAIGARPDGSALVDDLLLGFRPDGRAPYKGVLPCGAAHAMGYSPHGVDRTGMGIAEHPLESLGQRIAGAMDGGACLELTGGVDSRLLLALGVGAGGVPTRAFTIGRDDDPDVRVARQLADALGMEHRTLLAPPDEGRLPADARMFVAESGYACNAAAYGWLPSLFRELEGFRAAQLSGVGGEVGEGFYYTGLDGLFERLNSPRLWLRARAVVDGGRWASLFEPGVLADRLGEVARERTELQQRGPWRLRTDDFYLHARIHGWAVPVIRASAAWYEPITPFLSAEYLAWSRSLTAEQRHGRAAQRQAIDRLAPKIAGIPYAKSLESPSGGALARKLTRARRLVGRVLPRPTEQPLQWADTAASLMRSLDGADSVVDRLRTLEGVRADRVAEVLASDPRTSAHAIGAMLSMAWAIDRLTDSRPEWQD
ncbi:MAG: asparagine synthase-related protein [Phycisphaerales bacterium JB060]